MRRFSAVFGSIAALLATATPANAYMEYSGMEPGPGMSVLQTIATFVLLPIGIFAVVSLLWAIPNWRKR